MRFAVVNFCNLDSPIEAASKISGGALAGVPLLNGGSGAWNVQLNLRAT